MGLLLCRDGKVKHKIVHRLVADVFIPNLENKPEVNHLDGNKLNNYVKNLAWCTSKDNTHHAFEHNLMNSRKLTKNGMWKGYINIYSKEGVFITQVETTYLAAEWIRKHTIYKKALNAPISWVCNGKRRYNTAYGFIFKYSKEKI
jgi:hypothetical protein